MSPRALIYIYYQEQGIIHPASFSRECHLDCQTQRLSPVGRRYVHGRRTPRGQHVPRG
jgi:hypothetical protein